MLSWLKVESIVLNCPMIFGIKTQIPRAMDKPAEITTIKTDNNRGKPLSSRRSTNGLNIIAMRREIVMITIISMKIYAK
jgi:hypothetical protein